MKRNILFAVLAFIFASSLIAQAPELTSRAWIASGRNFDAAVANDKIYLISDNYYELDLDGNIIYTNENVNDIRQGVFDFHPALDVGSDGVVHVIHRLGEASSSAGFELNYSKREAGGTWSIENQVVGSEQPRNYVVDVVAMDGGEAVYGHSLLTTSDVDGQVSFYKLSNGGVDPWGTFGSSTYYRIDADFRMVRYGNTLHLATGLPWPTGRMYYMRAPIDPSLPTALASSADQFLTGGARTGMPDIKIDNGGRVFITSGDGDNEEVVFERFSNTGTHEVSNEILLQGLGSWHLDLGMSAMAASTTGDTILVVGLVTGGDAETASSSALRYIYSFDAGNTWSSYADIATRRTHACEGRNRPRIHYYDYRFYLFYNNAVGGISMTTFQFGEGPPPPPPVELVDPVDLPVTTLGEGKNFDVEVANQRIYLISDHYYEYNLAGELYAEDTDIVDSGQGLLDFGPALAVGSTGDVHVITRNGGSGIAGFNLFYSNRLDDNSWAVEENPLGAAVPRNYVVDVVALDGGEALFAHSSQKDDTDFGPLLFYRLNGSSTDSLGTLARDDLYKTNSDFRMERYGDTLYLASGKPYLDGTVYFMKSFVGPSLPSDLTAGITELSAGSGLSGQPDLRINGSGDVFVTYGSSESVLFNRYSAGGAADTTGLPVFGNLGSWHLDLGLSAMETSPDGDTLFAVGLKTDGTKEASNSSLYYSYSMDGGDNWVYPIEITNYNTNAGEGRMRPRVRYYSGRFYLFFNNVDGGIAVKTFDLSGISPDRAITPAVLPPQDSLTASDQVTIESEGSDAIHYSFTDPTPDMLSVRYTSPFTISSDTTIYAIAYKRGSLPSDVIAVSKKLKGEPPEPVELPGPVDLSLSRLAGGKNFDVEVANDRIYLISDHYYEFDLTGDSLTGNNQVIDEAQGTFDFGPAISVGPQGEVHMITRLDGEFPYRNNLMYSKKMAGGTWEVTNKQVGYPPERNYVVDVVALQDGEAIYAHSVQDGDEVWGSVSFYRLNGANVNPLGDFGRNDLYRIDSDFRMERYQDQIHMATGKPDPDGAAYYMDAAVSSTLPGDLSSGPSALLAGTGRRGMPDLRVDKSGNVFITYGSYQSVHFKRYSNDGSGNVTDTPIFSKLGWWHLELGLSAIAASPQGDTLLAVAIKTDGATKEGYNSSMLYTYSLDGGRNWVYPVEIPDFKTNAGEGRMRPRIKYYRERFYLFFNNVNGGIAVKTFDLRGKEMIRTAPPVIAPDLDTVAIWDGITLEAAGSDAIFYSITDTDPDILSTRYLSPLYLEEEATIYARAYRSGYLPSDVVSRTYKLYETTPLTDPVDLTKEKLCNGVNFDVAIAHDKIYLVSDHYYEFDLAGDLLEESTEIVDQGQGPYDFGPAIAVGDDHVVHIITRGAGPEQYSFNLNYSKKERNQTWPVTNEIVGSPVARNYVVDVVALDNGRALYSHSKQTTTDVYSSVFFYTLDGSSVASLGDLGSNYFYRMDSDFRMERFGAKLHLATGNPDPDGTTYYMNATIGAGLPADLASSALALKAGEGRRGQPDLRIDDLGNVFVSYGSEHSVIFNRYSNDGSGNVSGQPIFSQMGSWHLDLGMSAIASSPGGDTVLAVGLQTDGSVEASNCGLLYTYSFDGGRNWVYPYEIAGYRTNGSEGRMRPRVRFYRDRFYIFYNNLSGGIAVTTIDLRNLVLFKTPSPVILPEKSSVYTYEAISIEAPNSDAIFYSFVETNPDILSTLYEGPFFIDRQSIIFARAYRSGFLPSDVIQVTKQAISTSDEPMEGRGNESMTIYPVPASTILSLKSVSEFTGNVTIRVFNQMGQMVYLDQVNKSDNVLTYEIDVRNWTGGVYFMVLQSGSGSETGRFIVK